MGATRNLAEFASELTLKDLPELVVERTKRAILDIASSMVYASTSQTSQMVANYVGEAGVGPRPPSRDTA